MLEIKNSGKFIAQLGSSPNRVELQGVPDTRSVYFNVCLFDGLAWCGGGVGVGWGMVDVVGSLDSRETFLFCFYGYDTIVIKRCLYLQKIENVGI